MVPYLDWNFLFLQMKCFAHMQFFPLSNVQKSLLRLSLWVPSHATAKTRDDNVWWDSWRSINLALKNVFYQRKCTQRHENGIAKSFFVCGSSHPLRWSAGRHFDWWLDRLKQSPWHAGLACLLSGDAPGISYSLIPDSIVWLILDAKKGWSSKHELQSSVLKVRYLNKVASCNAATICIKEVSKPLSELVIRFENAFKETSR